jgi:gliding motility-associated-like protein
MKILYKIIILFILINFNSIPAYSINKAEENIELKIVGSPSGQITGNATVCLGAIAPLVKFEIIDDTNGKEPYTFNYTINGVAQAPVVTQGNNKSITISAPTNIANTFTYVLTGVKDADNNVVDVSGSNTVVITVNPLPVVDFTFTNNACSGTAVQFNTTSIGNSYTWNFDDEATSSLKNPTHTFTSLGCGTKTFNVTLTVTDSNGCSGTITKIITINQQPDISFEDVNATSAGNQFSNCTSASISNTSYTITVGNISTSSCITSYSINWGDGVIENNVGFPKVHTYSQLGAYNMMVTALGNNSCSNSKIYVVKNVSNPSGGILNPGGTTDMCIPTPVIQYAIGNWATNSPGTTYAVDYGDGSPILNLNQNDMVTTPYYNSITPSASLNYPVPYSYNTNSCPNPEFTIKLIVTNACKSTTGTVIGGNTISKPKANFTAPQNSCLTSNVLFTNTTILGYDSGCISDTKFSWDFGDSASGAANTINTGWVTNAPNVNHVFSGIGTFTVTLTTKNGCGTTTKTQQICIEPPLVPAFTLNNSGCYPLAVTATNTTVTTNSCTPPTYVWSATFVPSSCGTSIAPIPNQTTTNASYNFIESGTYTIKLTATNSCSPSQFTTKTVTVTKPPSVTINTIATLCQTLPTTTINPTATIVNCGTQSPLTYEWSFPSGTPATATTATPGPISYSASGTFSFSLKVTNECGSTTANGSITINPSPTITGTLFSCISSTSQLTGSATAAIVNPWTSSTPAVATVSPIGLVTGVSAGTTNITYTNSNNCITTALFTVNPTPVVNFSIANQIICSGDTSALVTLSSVAGATFNWTAVQPAGITGVSLTGNNTIPVQTLINSTNANIVVTFNATATLASGATCAGAVFPYTITVKPKPFIATNMTSIICSGSIFTVSPTNGAGNSIPTGTTYSWGIPVVTGGIAGGISGANATSISGTLTNPANVVQTATYTVTPSFNGCAGLPFDIVVSVNPRPDVNTTSNVILCPGDTSVPINFTGTVLGTTYTWSSNNSSIGITASATGTIPSFIAINAGTTPAIATITVTPSANSCPGLSKTFTITVNPTPVISPIASLVKCNTDASGAISFTGSVAGTTFDWTNDNPSIGLAAAGSGTIASFITTNIGLTPVIATITVTPKSNGCSGTSKIFTITVNPKPTVDLPLNQTVCNGQQTTAILFSGAISNTTYNWTNSNSTIGLGASGIGDIPPFTAINNGTNPIVASITVTPNLNGCSGASKTFTITINPSPAVTFSPTNQILCSGSSSVLVNLSSTAVGATFAWTAVQPAGITGVSLGGTNTIPVQTLINSTNLPIVVTYLATAQSNSGVSCQGISYPYTITVNPVPSITTAQTQTVCSNTAFSIIPLDGGGNSVSAGTTYSWGVPVITGGMTGGLGLANQTTITGTLINSTDLVQTATYIVSSKSGTCIGSIFTAVVTVNPSPKVLFSGGNQTVCSGSVGSLISLSSPTTGNVTFNWTANIPAGITGATSLGTGTIPTQTLVNTTTNLLTVIYSATATLDNNGVLCTGQAFDYEITVNPAIITSSILSNFNGFNVSTVGATDGAINVTVVGGSGVYTYLWSGPNGFSATSQDISNVASGAYSLTINDGFCNPVILNFNLASPMPLLIQEDTAAHIDVLCFGYSTAAIKVDVTQQSVGPYDYVLTLRGGGTISSTMDSAATNHTFSGLAAGIYDIKVTDANGSVKTILGVIITQPSGITAAISAQTNVSCAGSATGSATVSASGGAGNLTYSWNTVPIQTSVTAIGLTAGTYTVTITDANTCSVQKQVIISEPNGIVTSIASQTNVLCFGNNTGSATVSVSGGTGALTYTWDTIPVQTTTTVTGLVVGTYNLTVTDGNGCPKVQTVIITQPVAGLVSAISNSTNVSCFGGNDGKVTVTASGGTAPYTYSWNTIPAQTLATATGLKAGNYSVLVTDANGCSTSSPVALTEPVEMTASITAQTNVLCSGNSTGSATATANGGTLPYSYSWNTTPIQTSDVAVNLPIGTYTVIITDAKGCSTTVQATITEPNGIVTSIASQTNVDCFGNNTGAVSILASGGAGTLSYSWDTNPVQTTPSLTGLIAGIYHLTVTDANNCTKVQTVTITQPNDISITTDLEKDITCFNDADGEIKITVSGGTLNYNYAWTKNGAPYAATEDLANLSPGIYAISVSDANNCGPKTATFTITEPPILAVNLVSKTDILCFGDASGVITMNVAGGTLPYTYAWTGPNGFTSSTQNLTNVFAGSYNLKVTDNSGCFKTLSVTLTQSSEIIIKAATTPIICYGANDASISLTITGGITPYQILWSNLGGGTFQDNLSAGDYFITVTDALNCVKTLNVNIPEAPIFTVNPVVKNITCFGDKNGSINLNIVGGIAPVKLVWDDSPVAGNVRNNLGPGSYTVTIVDSKPCTIKKTFIILEPQSLVLSANVTNAFDCDIANSGAINLLVAGGSAPFIYSWSNGATAEDLNNIPAGNYLVTVTDKNGCSKQAQYSINRPPPIVTGVVTKTDFDCDTKMVKQTFVAQVSGGMPPYQLAWSSGTVSGVNNEMMNTNQNGTVILNVTDKLGCPANYSFNVKIPKLGSPSFNASSYAYLAYGTYSINDPIQFTNTATGDYISMVWDFGDGTSSTEFNPVHAFINPKDYVVTQTITYPFGCIYVQKITFIIEKGYLLVVPNAFTPNGDNLNDTFRPVTKHLKNVRLDIYDTWGSLIYSETGDVLRGWDAKIKGFKAENGNYFCKVSGETFYGTIVNENHPFVLIK